MKRMAPPAWLPPLNSHEYSIIKVTATERSFRSIPITGIEIKRKFLVGLQVYVDFYSENDVEMEEVFPGLCLSAIHSVDLKSLETSLRDNILNEDLVPFRLDSCLWTEHPLRGRPSPPLRLYGDDDLLQKLSNFVRLVDDKPENEDHMLVAVTVVITKTVMVPEQEFGSWVSWYEEQTRLHPEFEGEYRRAIERPRDRDEVFREAMLLMERRSARRLVVEELEVAAFDASEEEKLRCMICLEEFSDGARVIRLPCRHVFDEDCVVRWLRGNHVCPLCRHELPVDDDHDYI